MSDTTNTQYTNAELVNAVLGAVGAVQDAHGTLVEGVRKLNAHNPDMAAHAELGSHFVFNTRTVLTTSGTYTAPVSGWYYVILIGGGGGGGCGSDDSGTNWGAGGKEGGSTSLGSTTAKGGGGGAGGAKSSSTTGEPGGGGGGAGEVIRYMVKMTKGSNYAVIIGAGGLGGVGPVSTSAEAYGGGEYGGTASIATNAGWGGWCGTRYGLPGGNGTIAVTNMYGSGGFGGSTGLGYGGGGGGGAGHIAANTSGGIPGRASDGAVRGDSADGYGGSGGSGAIILCYFDPEKDNS